MATGRYLASFLPQSAEYEQQRPRIYTPLDIQQSEIRLMTIHPGGFHDRIRITLDKISLDQNPRYEAISYTWEDLSQTMTVDLHDCKYTVTKNQFEAVRQFRRSDTTRVLWMDVFCIDQSDLTEKSNQVGMMSEIYAGATTTLIWLGQFNQEWIGSVDSSQLDKVAEFLKNTPGLPRIPGHKDHIATSPHLPEFNNVANGENGSLSAALFVLLLLAEDHHLLQMPVYSIDEEGNPCPNPNWYRAIETVRLILERPWWERAWVLQEVAWSRQPPVVYIGSVGVPLQTFLSAAAAIYKHVISTEACCTYNFETWGLRNTADRQALITRVPILYGFHAVRDLIQTDQASFQRAVAFSSNRKVTDPRDCIYSLLSLAPKEQRVRVDYNQTVGEVYTSASWMSIKLANSLNALEYGGSKNEPNSWPIPSWVQNWSKKPSYGTFFNWIHNIETYTISPDWKRTVLNDDGSLVVPQVPLDIIEACFPAIAASHDWTWTVLTTIWLRQLKESGYQDFDLPIFIKTVFRNTSLKVHSMFTAEDVEILVTYYQQYLEPERSVEPEPPLGFTSFDVQYAFSSSIRESCLFVTEQKRLGIGHEGIKPGDMLSHVKGCCVPLTIRKAAFLGLLDDEDAAQDSLGFTLIDACYVDGYMNLESLRMDWEHARDIKLV